MKTLFKLLLLVGLVVYLIFAFANFTQQGDQTICQNVNVTISDSMHSGFITVEEAKNILRKANQYPIGRQMDKINSIAIEKALKKNTFIDSVSCYKSPNGNVNVIIEQRLPVVRVKADNGEEYYIDKKGRLMNPKGYTADLVIATGPITRKFACSELVKIGTFLQEDEFWCNQIEQINVLPNLHLQLVPRVGDHIIEFGTTEQIPIKFRNLYTFYEKVLPEVGWNKYSSISVEHISQIVGRKAQEKRH